MFWDPRIEFVIPVLVAFFLGALIGVLTPGQKERRGIRVLLGTVGGLAGVVVGFVVALNLVRSPGAVNITVLAVCALLGAVSGAVIGR
jgi:hypothetical protein